MTNLSFEWEHEDETYSIEADVATDYDSVYIENLVVLKDNEEVEDEELLDIIRDICAYKLRHDNESCRRYNYE